MQTTIIKTSKKKNWSAVSARPWLLVGELRTVQSIKKNSLSLNASSAAQLPNGSVGVTLIFVKNAIRNNAQEIIFLGKLKTSCQNAWVKTVL